ncbi:hypothetical protein ACVW1A_000149 [Bradyrhizobium sp. LB1.3]
MILFGNAKPGSVVGFLPGLGLNRCNGGLNALFDGQVQLTLLIVQRALLANKFSLSLLGFGQLAVIRLQKLTELGSLINFADSSVAEASRAFLASEATIRSRSAVNRFATWSSTASRCELFAFQTERLSLARDFSIFSRELFLEALAGLLEQRRGKRFRQSNFVIAVRTM